MKRKSPKTAEAEAREFFEKLPAPKPIVTLPQTASVTENVTKNANKTGTVTLVTPVTLSQGDEGAKLLSDVESFLGNFVIYPTEAAKVAHVLWIAHTHLMDVWDSTPRLAFLSPEAGSGKSRALEVTGLLVPRPVEAVNVTPAYLFRKVGGEDGIPTILHDEIDTVFGKKTAKDNEEIRGLLNAGHRRDAVAGRCVVKGKTIETEEISAYCAVALAGLGWLPETITSRAVNIRMKKRKPSEKIKPFRRRVYKKEGHDLCDRLSRWAVKVEKSLRDVWPAMPEGIEDRNADVWEALLAVADAAGGDWPKRGREAAVVIVKSSQDIEASLGIRLLADLMDSFGTLTELPTEEAIPRLHAIKEAPWSKLKDGPLNERGLARYLKGYDIAPHVLSGEGRGRRGYRRVEVQDAWERYVLPRLPPDGSVTSVTAVTNAENHNVINMGVVTDVVTDSVTHPSGSVTSPITCRITIREIRAVRPPAISAGPDDDLNDLAPL